MYVHKSNKWDIINWLNEENYEENFTRGCRPVTTCRVHGTSFPFQEKEEKSIESYQLEYINSGNKFLSKSKGLNALYSFYFATSFNFDNEPMTEYEKYARTKVDSLLPIYQAIEKEKSNRAKLEQKEMVISANTMEII